LLNIYRLFVLFVLFIACDLGFSPDEMTLVILQRRQESSPWVLVTPQSYQVGRVL
jgi:hypothetical protein